MNAGIKNFEKLMELPWGYTVGKMLLVAILSQTQIAGVYPFGIAYAAALAEQNTIAAILALAAGMIFAGKEAAAKYIFAIIIYAAMVFFRKFKAYAVKAVALGVALVISCAAVMVKTGATPAEIILLLPEAFATGGLFLLFSSTKKEGIRAYAKDIILAGACLAGAYGLIIPYIGADAAILAGMIIIMCVSYSCGIPAAVLTGAALGFMILIETTASVEVAGIFAIAAAVAAAAAKMGKAGVSTGFLSGMTVCVLCMGKLGALSIADIFTAPVIFLLLPEKFIIKTGNRVNSFFEKANGGAEKVAEQLKTVAQAVGELGNGVKILSDTKKEEDNLCETVRESVCKNCRRVEGCSVVSNMSILKTVLEKDGYLNISNAPQGLGKICIRAETLLKEFSHTYEICKQKEVDRGEVSYDRNIAINQYGEISNIIESLSNSVSEAAENAEKSERYGISVAVCQEPRGGQEINGDTVIHFKKGAKYFVILCDGMGSGKAAREISSLSARLFAEFLNSGIDKKSAVNMINSALALNADRESFSSADILEIDLSRGMAEFMKIGSAQSFIKRGEEVAEVSSSALPIGILEKIEVAPQSFSVSQGDMILMVSDGISEASSGIMKNEWIKRLFLTGEESDAELAKRFLESAKSRTIYSDDMTSVIVRIKAA